MAKRKCLSIEKKCLIISEINKRNKKKKDIAEEFGISPTTLSTILKNKDKIEEASSSNVRCKFQKARLCEYPDVDEAMIKWTTVARHKNIPLSGPINREKVKEFVNHCTQKKIIVKSTKTRLIQHFLIMILLH